MIALAGVAQWTELWPANQKVTDSIPSLGIWLEACERQRLVYLLHTDVSLPFSLPSPLSKNK